jgi:hypothetical protein
MSVTLYTAQWNFCGVMYVTRQEQKNTNVIDILNSAMRIIIFDLSNSYTDTELNL